MSRQYTGPMVGGIADGKYVAHDSPFYRVSARPDPMAHFLQTADIGNVELKIEHYRWEPLVARGLRGLGFWRHESLSVESAILQLVTGYRTPKTKEK